MVMLQAMLDDCVMMATPALAGLQPLAAMLVGPQQRAVGIVDQAVAVRPDDRHVAGGRDQFAPAGRSPSAS